MEYISYCYFCSLSINAVFTTSYPSCGLKCSSGRSNCLVSPKNSSSCILSSILKIIQKSEILSKSRKYDWKLMIYGVLAIWTGANWNRENANLNRNYVTISLLKIGTGNRMEKPGKTWQELQLYRQLARFGMKKSCGRFDCVGLLRFTYRQTALHKVILQP